MARADLSHQLSVNTIGPHHLIRTYLPEKLKSSSTIYCSMSWAEGSAFAPMPAYNISKAVLNALTVQYALSYTDEGFTFMAIHPGWLRTDMGGQDADLSVEEGATAVWEMVSSCTQTQNGQFMNIHIPGSESYTWDIIPW
ncbi:NAD(P)-binding protein [Aspergillus niger ATCC 13496]|uniref:NAD(P)-binding protein n=2 Tax=Aspergillus niger TaxID=5061 RepID=A0A370CCQ3_ASPNG|nr:NAD(P)-binding protein [Aspergillus niger ATCC 13496]